MTFSELIVLLPCHSLEDFPLYHEGPEAEGLLAGWSALWHPELIAGAGRAPSWQRVDAPPAEIAGRLIVVPPVADDRLPVGFVARAQEEGALLVRKLVARDAILAVVLEAVGGSAIDPELVADFLALGYCRLQVELLTRQMRYSSNIDETAFERFVVAAALAAREGNLDETRTQLTGCFNLLNEARKYFYPVDAYLVDLTLAASTTLGPALAAELAQTVPMNLLISGELVGEIAAKEPATLAALRAALERRSVTLLGGELTERELPLLPLETIGGNLTAGLAEYERVLGCRPTVFGRRRYGLAPTLPQVLSKLGFLGALHITLDDGRFPLGAQSKVRWEGDDSTPIDALARLPRDAAKPETFLDFARRMGEAMDADHVASVVLAHWPGQVCPWYADMRRIARYTTALGKFVTLDEYFGETYAPGQTARFMADEYRSPYLKQAIIRRQVNPISSVVAAHKTQAREAAIAAVETLVSLVSRKPMATAQDTTSAPCEQRLAKAAEQFAATLPPASAASSAGTLVINPLSFGRRVLVKAASSTDELALVEVPPMGFAFVAGQTPAAAAKRDKPLAEGNQLRNEFFEVTIHPTGGGIQVIHDYQHRANRLSQQLALRAPGGSAPVPGEVWRDPDEDAVYSSMLADSIEVTHSGPQVGEIVSRGNLLDAEGRRLSGFVQRTQVWRGSRIVRIDVELDPAEEPRADPWNSYFAARFAWSDSGAEIFRGVQAGRQPTDAKRIEAPEYLEIVAAQGSASILTAGLPYHRRSAVRVIDSLLITRGESARRFQFGIGIDLPNPAAAAAELLAPSVQCTRNAPANSSGWLFHVDARNVIATHWEPLTSFDSGTGAEVVSGFRVRLLETTGRAAKVSLRAFRALAEARKTDYLGQTLSELVVEGDRLACDLVGHEWAQIEARW